MGGSDIRLRTWITEVRGKESKSSFAGKIYHFRNKGSVPVCLSYSRATIANWESGVTAPPRDIETILSIALVEFDNTHGKDFDRIDRYLFARSRLNEMLGLDLWCRNLHDAVLIQVCRGLLEFADVTDFETELLNSIRMISLNSIEKDEYAIERKTEAISNALTEAADLKQVRSLITGEYAGYFASQHWLTGARFRNTYNKRDRIYGMKLPLRAAIVNLAPNYSNSFNNMFNGSFIGRGWLIDLCTRLRFSSDEINEVLEATHNAQLTDEESLPDDYSYFTGKPLIERLKILLLLAVYAGSISDEFEKLPVEYLLDPFRPGYESGRTVIRMLDDYLNEAADSGAGDADELYNCEAAHKWNEVIWRTYEDEMFIPEISNELRKEALAYFQMNREQTVNIRNYADDADHMHFLAALSYTVLTGRRYTGDYHDSDLDEIRPLFRTGSSEMQGIYDSIFKFISHILGTFLGSAAPYETEDGKFYTINESKGRKKSRSLDLETVTEDLIESVMILDEDTQTE